MSTSDLTLLARWQERRDASAFQEIVTRHGGMVYATCRRILYNPADAEEVAQECFLALSEANTRRIRVLGGWLHTLATRRALDRVRADTRRREREQKYGEETAAHAEPSWDDIQQFVDEAIIELPEKLKTVVVGHFLEGQSQAELAQSLKLSPSAVSRRVDRGVEQIRDTLRKRQIAVGAATLSGLLSEAATAEMPASLAAKLGKAAIAGQGSAATSGAAALTAGGAVFAFKIAVPAIVVAVLAALAFTFAIQFDLFQSGSSAESSVEAEPTVTAVVDASEPAQTQTPPLPATAEAVAGDAPGGAAVSGVVVFRDSGNVASNVRVLLGPADGEPIVTVTGEDGSFTFESIAPGEQVLIAYDAAFDEMPEDEFRSEHTTLTLAEGETVEDLRIEVPAQGGRVIGRVTAKASGKPLAGIKVETFRAGSRVNSATTDKDGDYTILGLPDGEWRIHLDRDNPVFVSGIIDDMITVFVKKGETTRVDLAVDTGIALSGRAVNARGEPVAEAVIEADLFPSDQSGRRDCYLRTDAAGRFTVWGAKPGDQAVFSARNKELASHIAVVNPVPKQAVTDLELVMHPKVSLTGRFEDEEGRPVKANIWHRAIHPDGNESWSGQADEPAETFTIDLGPGKYEIKGRPESMDYNVEELTQTVDVAADTNSEIVVTVRTTGEMTGNYALSGKVVDEDGEPLRTRVYVDGATRENLTSFQETHTNAQGRFEFEGLMDAPYRVHATPGPPYLKHDGFDSINPADTSEVTIVARYAPQVRGHVVDADTGEPIQKFDVEVGGLRFDGYEHKWDTRNITSNTGEFAIPARPDEDWYIRIVADGYTQARHAGAALAAGETTDDVVIEMARGQVVRGTVTNVQGEAVPNVRIYYNEDVYAPSKARPRDAATVTAADGRFTVGSLPPDAEYIYARTDGYAVASAPVAEEVNIVLTVGGFIEGRVTMNGAPVPEGTAVSARWVENPRAGYFARTGADGYYRITGIADGTYRLRVTLAEGRTPSSGFLFENHADVADGMATTFNAAIPRGHAAIEGRITLDGKPAPERLLLCHRAGMHTMGYTDTNGRYRFDDLPAGPIRIEAYIHPGEFGPGVSGPKTIMETEVQANEVSQADYELRDIN